MKDWHYCRGTTILALSLLLVFVNDLPSIDNRSKHLIMYVDDNNNINFNKSQKSTSKMLNKITTWFDNNKLNLNSFCNLHHIH